MVISSPLALALMYDGASIIHTGTAEEPEYTFLAHRNAEPRQFWSIATLEQYLLSFPTITVSFRVPPQTFGADTDVLLKSLRTAVRESSEKYIDWFNNPVAMEIDGFNGNS